MRVEIETMDNESSTPPPSGQARAPASSGRRRVGGLVLVALVVAGAVWLATRRPVECELSLTFGARAPEVRTVRLTLRERDGGDDGGAGRLLRTITLQLPSGATAAITRSVKLRPGSYRAEAVITDAAGRERTVRRTLTIEREACTLPIELGE